MNRERAYEELSEPCADDFAMMGAAIVVLLLLAGWVLL